MFFNIPYCILVGDDFVCNHLMLVEAPGRQLTTAVSQSGARVYVYETYQGPNTVPCWIVTFAVHDVHTPEILCRHRHIVVDVTRYLLKHVLKLTTNTLMTTFSIFVSNNYSTTSFTPDKRGDFIGVNLKKKRTQNYIAFLGKWGIKPKIFFQFQPVVPKISAFKQTTAL